MRKTALALAVAGAAVSAGAQAPTPPDAAARGARPPAAAAAPPAASPAPSTSTSAPLPKREQVERGTVLEEVSGKVADIDRRNHALRVETASGQVTLSLDRNTMVYTAKGLGTVLDVTPGAQIRVGRNADFLAYWIQVRATPPLPPSTPGQGTGPAGGGSTAAGESVGTGAGAAPGPAGGGSAAASESVGTGAGAAPAPPATGAGPGTGAGGTGSVGVTPP